MLIISSVAVLPRHTQSGNNSAVGTCINLDTLFVVLSLTLPYSFNDLALDFHLRSTRLGNQHAST
jgi:hypothetical protein